MIHVCDAIMGSGKSQSAISYINEHPGKHFVYITPYLSETERIRNACPEADFVLPNARRPGSGYSKLGDTKQLLEDGRNISATHTAFRMYTPEMIENIRRWKYTLIIDEAVNVLCEMSETTCDMDVMLAAGFVEQTEDGSYRYTGKPYGGGRLDELFRMLKCNNILRLSGNNKSGKGDILFYWQLHPDVMRAFGDVFILTYMFDGQDVKYYLDMYKLDYKMIGISRDGDTYRFSEKKEYYPAYIARLGNMIHVFENEKLNKVGARQNALSSSWYANADADKITQIKNNTYNFFHNYNRDIDSDRVMWATFKEYEYKIRPKGYSRCATSCTLRASNEYRDRTVMAYLVNIFTNPFKHRYFSGVGAKFDDDAFALSTMIQWIWRSAIRDGGEISIYVPSSRMRGLLKDWIAKEQAAYNQRLEGGDDT